jgi:phytoene synthase
MPARLALVALDCSNTHVTLEAYVTKAAPPLSDAYYVRLFSPGERRERVTAVLACAAEIDECVREAREPAIAQLKLAWWQEEIDLLARGAPRHPVTTALAQSPALASAPAVWLDLIRAARRELEPAPHVTVEVLLKHCVEAAALHELLALAFDAVGAALEHARALGAAIVNARFIGSARHVVEHGKIELPLDLLAAAGVQPEALSGEWPRPALDLLARLGAQARAGLSGAIEAIPASERKTLQSCLIMGALQEARLGALAAHDYVHTHDGMPALKRLWIAWRAAAKALRNG